MILKVTQLRKKCVNQLGFKDIPLSSVHNFNWNHELLYKPFTGSTIFWITVGWILCMLNYLGVWAQ
jgi:hypothetical protein